MFSSYYPYPPAQWKTRSHFSSRPRGQLGWPTSNGIRRTERKLETIGACLYFYCSSLQGDSTKRLIDIKHRDNMGRTQLHHAVLRADVVLVKHVLEMHGDVHAYDDTGYQPLHCIVLDGVGKDFKSFAANSREIIQALCSAGAIVDSQDGQGLTTLHAAFVKGSLSVVCALLEAGADVNVLDSGGIAPLHRAVAEGSPSAVQLLLQAGADPDLCDAEGPCPLHFIIESLATDQGEEAVASLLEAGAD
ncbi:hypothetical protein BOTBODRAFT_109233, partial [Botryobasidium botryosum FD-172 SS1]